MAAPGRAQANGRHADMKIRTTTRTGGQYRYHYHVLPDSAQDAVNGCDGGLTFGEHWRNQFHNEVQALLALKDTGLAPRIVDYDPGALSLTVDDVGEPQRELTRGDIGPCLERFASMHRHMNERPASFKDVWHSLVREDYCFSARAGFLADALPGLIALSRTFPRRFAKADSGRENILPAADRLVVMDFQTAHVGYQNVDVVELLWSFDPLGEDMTCDDWLAYWRGYASRVAGKESPEELCEFLYLIIRKTLWSLRKPELQPGEHIKTRALRAHEELRSMGAL